MGYFKVVLNHSPGPCRVIQGEVFPLNCKYIYSDLSIILMLAYANPVSLEFSLRIIDISGESANYALPYFTVT